MKASDLYPSRYLSSADVRAVGGSIVDFIEYVTTEEMQNDKGKENKPVIFFRTNKPMVMNRTNFDFLAERIGDDTDTWGGAKVQIVVEKVRFGNELKDGLRVKNARIGGATQPAQSAALQPATAPAPRPAPVPTPAVGEWLDDEIPF